MSMERGHRFKHGRPRFFHRLGLVVDAQCRAHEHPNLFVVGSSVFPTVGSPNPTLTIAALALRAAQDIADQLGFKTEPQI